VSILNFQNYSVPSAQGQVTIYMIIPPQALLLIHTITDYEAALEIAQLLSIVLPDTGTSVIMLSQAPLLILLYYYYSNCLFIFSVNMYIKNLPEDKKRTNTEKFGQRLGSFPFSL
jgi:hypothetical protein